MADEFFVPVTVRGYETDVQGHLNQAVYLQYAEHARWELFEAAGIRQQDLQAAGLGPVVLETTIRYKRELRAGDKVEVTCAFAWGTGKTFRLTQTIRKPDGTVSAEVTALGGFLDLKERRLIAEPAARIGALAKDPSRFGL
ncbi:acyl-CoA thioesterase [Streptomyces sp. TRM66268-LWL]|uniref:Acyl-CoA thioesterase n=1 Tax=Streptomyces polyasparticus TaxID=2767826 RepID=A0ABR7SCH9_9ACTN|nr:acyl-CoA thioesterase [Streptomyces polyasparticus]MBC9712864.1 acyl-CoA thioesterase [Streptomyces polyasparticus]